VGLGGDCPLGRQSCLQRAQGFAFQAGLLLKFPPELSRKYPWLAVFCFGRSASADFGTGFPLKKDISNFLDKKVGFLFVLDKRGSILLIGKIARSNSPCGFCRHWRVNRPWR
jgi:hypothetical protein